MKFINWIFLLPVLISLGCGQQSAAPEEDSVLKAYKLIDQDRAEEAVALIEPEHRANPKDRRLTITLASAHTSLAGLQVYSFYDLLEHTVFNKSSQGSDSKFSLTPPKLDLTGDDSQKARNFVSYLVSYLTYIDTLLSIYQKIPSLTMPQKKHLEIAVALLETLNPQEKSDGLFKAVLRVVYFKYQIEKEFVPSMIRTDKDNVCQLNFSNLTDNVWNTLVSLENILSDLTIAYPKKESDYNQAINDAKKMADQLITGVTALELVGNGAVDLLIGHLKQQGMGDQIKCTF
jgi:hypothetical protein